MRSLLCAIGLSGLLMLGGCDSGQAPAQSPVQGNYATEPPPPAGHGVIRGKVTLVSQSGNLPKPIMIRGHGGQQIPDERVVVGSSGELKNVVVYIEDFKDDTGPKRPPVVVDQVNFRYTPHVTAVQVGQPLRVRSSDDALHNVHIRAKANPETNHFTRTANEWLDYVYDKPEVLRLKCDVHPWMSAYVVVTENPYFAVSADDGSYEITGIPDGQYKLVAWHELYGRREQMVTVTAGTPVQQDFTFEAP